MNKCETCKFFDPDKFGANAGYCRIRAPIGNLHGGTTGWPWVKGAQDWCGEHAGPDKPIGDVFSDLQAALTDCATIENGTLLGTCDCGCGKKVSFSKELNNYYFHWADDPEI